MSVAILDIPVPANGLGAVVDISALIGQKTVIFTGQFSGAFTLLVSHNGTKWAPAAFFDSAGRESIVTTLSEAFRFAAVQSNGFSGVNSTLKISGVTRPGENLFAVLATLAPGAMGPQTSVDTWALFPPTGLEAELNVICEGSFEGYIVVEGSQDNLNFNSLGNFQALQSRQSGDLQFASLAIPAFIRYLRVVANGTVLATTVVTLGGRITASNQSTVANLLELSDDEGKVVVGTGRGPTEDIIYEYEVDLSKLVGGASIAVQINGVAMSTTGAAVTFNVYLGATAPGDTAGSTLVASANTSSAVEVGISAQGAAFVNPGGLALVQVTGEVTNLSDQAHLRGIFIVIG
jgi:hypothetical protein